MAMGVGVIFDVVAVIVASVALRSTSTSRSGYS